MRNRLLASLTVLALVLATPALAGHGGQREKGEGNGHGRYGHHPSKHHVRHPEHRHTPAPVYPVPVYYHAGSAHHHPLPVVVPGHPHLVWIQPLPVEFFVYGHFAGCGHPPPWPHRSVHFAVAGDGYAFGFRSGY